jgi:regulatory protein YycI of two-component signal transduction system YycFG
MFIFLLFKLKDKSVIILGIILIDIFLIYQLLNQIKEG